MGFLLAPVLVMEHQGRAVVGFAFLHMRGLAQESPGPYGRRQAFLRAPEGPKKALGPIGSPGASRSPKGPLGGPGASWEGLCRPIHVQECISDGGSKKGLGRGGQGGQVDSSSGAIPN